MTEENKPKKLQVKPSKEEIEANLKKAQGEIEELDKKKKPKSTPKQPPEPPKAPKKPEKPKELEPDYKEKFLDERKKRTASTQEAQILHAKNKKINEALDKASQVPDPTEEELTTEYPDWEVMSPFEKKMAKETMLASRRFKALGEITQEFKDTEKWQEKVEGFLGDPKSLVKYPGLEGKEDEFRLFATKPTRRGIEFGDLVAAFLYKAESSQPKPKKGKMFEVGSGGPKEKPKTTKLSLEDAQLLRQTDFKKYKEYLKAGKIEIGEL